jgi:putative transcriptional regulator
VTQSLSGYSDPVSVDWLLAHYAAGHLTSCVHALVEGHLEIQSENRAFTLHLENSFARYALQEEIPICDSNSMLASIFSKPLLPLSKSASSKSPRPEALLPSALIRYANLNEDQMPWQKILFSGGVHEISLGRTQEGHAKFYKIPPKVAMPQHTHEGLEVTLVLKGSFSDVTGTYKRGMIALADDDVDHQPISGDDEECICFAVIDAPLHLTGRLGRWIDPVIGPIY